MKKLIYGLKAVGVLALVLISNLYLQWCQNNLSLDLALKFAFSWHTEKFFLGGLVLLALLLFLSGVIGSLGMGAVLYTVFIGILGYADYLKMTMRQEPIYPDDLKMAANLGMMKDLVGLPLFLVLLVVILAVLVGVGYMFWRSLKKPKNIQILRLVTVVLSGGLLLYASNFNSSSNLLRKGYDRTALWIPYSQKMNYYNVGFVGGFLYNLKVEAMEKPKGYSEAAVKEITERYQKEADAANKKVKEEEQPNIVYVMSESFSDPNRLKGVTVSGDPLKDYYEVANQRTDAFPKLWRGHGKYRV